MLDVPVLLIVYRRPDLTSRALDAIATARPRQLFVAADGAASDGERSACAAVRAAATRVTSPCQVYTDFSSTNLGCSARLTSAIDSTFSHTDPCLVPHDHSFA